MVRQDAATISIVRSIRTRAFKKKGVAMKLKQRKFHLQVDIPWSDDKGRTPTSAINIAISTIAQQNPKGTPIKVIVKVEPSEDKNENP